MPDQHWDKSPTARVCVAVRGGKRLRGGERERGMLFDSDGGFKRLQLVIIVSWCKEELNAACANIPTGSITRAASC